MNKLFKPFILSSISGIILTMSANLYAVEIEPSDNQGGVVTVPNNQINSETNHMNGRSDHMNTKPDYMNGGTNHRNGRSDQMNTKPDYMNGGTDHMNTKSDYMNGKSDQLGSQLNQVSREPTSEYIMQMPNKLKWAPGPTGLPRGAQVSILEGDPNAEGPFTIRIKLPAKYRIPPHWHPIIEHVTVLSGKFHMGMGDHYDEKKEMVLPPGGFASIQPEIRHYAFTREPVMLQLHGNGPWGISYVNPQDDPRQQNGS